VEVAQPALGKIEAERAGLDAAAEADRGRKLRPERADLAAERDPNPRDPSAVIQPDGAVIAAHGEILLSPAQTRPRQALSAARVARPQGRHRDRAAVRSAITLSDR
jgi:hypothetical protein